MIGSQDEDHNIKFNRDSVPIEHFRNYTEEDDSEVDDVSKHSVRIALNSNKQDEIDGSVREDISYNYSLSINSRPKLSLDQEAVARIVQKITAGETLSKSQVEKKIQNLRSYLQQRNESNNISNVIYFQGDDVYDHDQENDGFDDEYKMREIKLNLRYVKDMQETINEESNSTT